MIVFAGTAPTLYGVIFAAAGAVITFLLVRICVILFRTGTLDLSVKRMPTLDNCDIKMEIFFENDTAREVRLHGLGLAYIDENEKIRKVSELVLMPIQRSGGSSFFEKSKDGYCFIAKPNSKNSAIIEFRLRPEDIVPAKARVFLISKNHKGKPIRAEANLDIGVYETLRFKRY